MKQSRHPLSTHFAALLAPLTLCAVASVSAGNGTIVLDSFSIDVTATADAIAIDPASGNLFVHESFAMVHQYTQAGVATGTPFLPPGAASNDFDLDFAPIDCDIGGTLVLQGTLLAGNGDASPRTLSAISSLDGTTLATVDLPAAGRMVGIAYHASRNTAFVLDFNSDQVIETNASTGAVINSFPVTPTGSPAFDVFFGDIEVIQNSGNLLIVSSNSSGRMRELTAIGEFVRDIDLSAGGTSYSGIAYDDETGEFWVVATTGDVVHFAPIGTEQSVTEPAGSAAGDSFGSAVAVDGNLMVVGLPGADTTGTDAGAVAIYRIEAGSAVLESVIEVPPGFTAAGFGASVAASGDTIVVGTAATVTSKVASALAAAILQRTANGGPFTFRQALTGNGMASGNDQFGRSVSISGNAVVVGAPQDDEGETGGMGSGAAYVFNRVNNSMNFDPPMKVKPPEPDPLARFGAAVAVRNNKIAVGAPDAKPAGGMATGSASIYSSLSGSLNRLGTVTGSGSGSGARFGAAVAVDTDGTVAVTAPQEADTGQQPSGAAYLINTSGAQLNQTHRIKPEDPIDDGQFGAAVAVDNGSIVIGSPAAENNGQRNGAVYRFRKTGGSVGQVSRTSPFPGQTGLGSSVAISADRVVSGAPQSQSSLGSALLQLDTDRVFGSGFEL